MKIIFLLLSFVFVSCVTANTGERDLSVVNTEIGSVIALSRLLNDCFDDCECRGEDYRRRCRAQCRRQYSKKAGIKVASIGDQNPFNLLKESQNNFDQLSTKDKNHEDKSPLMLADDYDCCVRGCIGDGGSSSQCHRVCEE